MTRRPLRLLRDSYPGRPALDVAVSRALLQEAGANGGPDTLRLYIPNDVVAFGIQDRAEQGFARAVKAAEEVGFGSVIRLAGGRAAVFHSETMAFSLTIADAQPHSRTLARFRETSEVIASALRDLGIDARVGELPGEYCPGEYSVHARGKKKLVGIGQRIIKGAAHVGGVIVVDGARRIVDVLVPVYRELGLTWDPDTAGSIREEVAASREDVERTLLEAMASGYEIEESSLQQSTVKLAETLEADHRPDTTRP